jgi:5-methylcytosine-specific restriction endonuclease McrBC GTP-binding regulatory subunit McrB
VANDDMGWNRKITFKNDLDENDQQLISDLLHCVGTFEMVVSQKNDNQKKPRTDKEHPINFIVYGAPGTGKTYSMVEYALAIVDNISIEDFQKDNQDRKTNIARYKELVNDGQIVFTTFHQNYGYEDFIQGLRPDTSRGTLSFKIVDGLFKKIADKALDDGDNNYVIIIDEINRANISKVFGELITLIEEDKRWGELNEMSVTLQSGDDFVVPNNLYIIGTMNSADKSISLIDAALRRRFEFIEKKPDASLVQNDILRKIFISINENLVKELDSTDLLVGHSYFMNKTEKDLCKILNNNIIPLLYEYFYDNRKKVATLLKEVIDESCANVEIVDEKMGRLSVKDKVE